MNNQVGRVVRGIVNVRAEGGADVKALVDGLQKAFHDFKAEHTSQLNEIKKGTQDVVKAEKVERILADVTRLQTAIDEQNAKLAAAQLGAGVDGKQPKDPEYSEAFRAHFRKGDVQAALNKGAADEGGYLAPTEWDRTITDKLVLVSPMRQIASVQSISTNGFKKLFNLGGTASGWVGETAARPQTNTGTFAELAFNTGEIYANPAATQGLLDDSEINLEGWLANEVEQEFALQEGTAFVSGDGSNKPRGFLGYAAGGAHAAVHPFGVIPEVASADVGDVGADDILSLIYDLPSAFTADARFTMNRTTLGKVMKLKDANGNYLWQPSLQAGQPSTLAGYPVTEMPDMPDVAAGALPIAFGDFRRGYLIVDRVGVRVLRDPYTNKPYVMFYTTKRVGGGVLNPQVLRLLRAKAE